MKRMLKEMQVQSQQFHLLRMKMMQVQQIHLLRMKEVRYTSSTDSPFWNSSRNTYFASKGELPMFFVCGATGKIKKKKRKKIDEMMMMKIS